jgi:hypothetical protein
MAITLGSVCCLLFRWSAATYDTYVPRNRATPRNRTGTSPDFNPGIFATLGWWILADYSALKYRGVLRTGYIWPRPESYVKNTCVLLVLVDVNGKDYGKIPGAIRVIE